MGRICLAGIDPAMVPMFASVLTAAGERSVATLVPLDVRELHRIAPNLLVCDVDQLESDGVEMLRKIRFVLPECMLAVYTGIIETSWSRACHLAGANCVLSKDSSVKDLSKGLRGALRTGCYSDPRFATGP